MKSQLTRKQNWSDSNDLDLMFQNTFNNKFYRQLHGYVHSVYQKHKGYHALKKLFSSPLTLSYRDLRSGVKTIYYIPKTFAQGIKLRKLQETKVEPQ